MTSEDGSGDQALTSKSTPLPDVPPRHPLLHVAITFRETFDTALAGMARAFTPRLLDDAEGYRQRRDDGAEGEEDQEWAKLQALPNEEYLMRCVMPVLYQGMRVVDQQRPVAPLEYLALYLLKNQDKIKLPQKPAEV